MSLNEQRRLPQALPSLEALCGQSHRAAAQQMRNTQDSRAPKVFVCVQAGRTNLNVLNKLDILQYIFTVYKM